MKNIYEETSADPMVTEFVGGIKFEKIDYLIS